MVECLDDLRCACAPIYRAGECFRRIHDEPPLPSAAAAAVERPRAGAPPRPCGVVDWRSDCSSHNSPPYDAQKHSIGDDRPADISQAAGATGSGAQLKEASQKEAPQRESVVPGQAAPETFSVHLGLFIMKPNAIQGLNLLC